MLKENKTITNQYLNLYLICNLKSLLVIFLQMHRPPTSSPQSHLLFVRHQRSFLTARMSIHLIRIHSCLFTDFFFFCPSYTCFFKETVHEHAFFSSFFHIYKQKTEILSITGIRKESRRKTKIYNIVPLVLQAYIAHTHTTNT